MSKELEAFERVWEDCSRLDLGYVSKHNLMSDLIDIKQALTPPTEDVVIKALIEYYGRNVFRDNAFYYETTIDNNKIWLREVSLKELLKDNRADLIIMIGRFYKSLEEKSNE